MIHIFVIINNILMYKHNFCLLEKKSLLVMALKEHRHAF